MILAVVLQLALWTFGAFAFYPYTPDWLREKEERALASAARRNAGSNSAGGGVGVAFAIEQRGAENDDSPAQRAARQAAWLRAKFAHTRGQRSVGTHDGLGRRSGNTYKVMEAVNPGQPMAAGICQDGTDYSYFIKAQLGSKHRDLYLLLDTGAGSSWVMGSSCTDKACTMHATYGPGDSDSLAQTQKPFSISYGSGTVEGKLASDTISVAGISVQYTFGLASTMSDDFTHFAFDGILGMSMSQAASDNFLGALADGKKLDKNMFGVSLNRAADGSNTGEIRFGATNPARHKGAITYSPVVPKDGDWCIQLDDMAYDGKKAGSGGVLAYIDTGTSFVFGPADLVKKLHAVIPGAASGDEQTYAVPCDSKRELTFTFSGVDYKLSPEDWISPKDGDGRCTSNVYGHEVVPGAWLLGATFLKNVYTVFDKDQARVGFAAAAEPPGGSSAPLTPSSDASGTRAKFAPGAPSAPGAASGDAGQAASLPLGLSGHETPAGNATGSVPAPTQSPDLDSAAAAPGPWSSQHAKMAGVVFWATVLTLVV